jgi:hypothetical protein
MRFKIFSCENFTISKKSWKTYNGAVKNCKQLDIVIPDDSDVTDWMKRHPEWIKERIEAAKNL